MAQFEILTRAKDEIEGTRVRVDASRGEKQIEVAGAPIGTQVVVRNLFYNAPARRKFLKAPPRETELIQKMLVQYALAYPQIAFRLIVDGRENLVAPAASPLERLGAVWGREVAGEMIAVDYASVDLRVRGFVSRPSLARANREWQAFFVNGRPIRSGLLAVMLERPYAGRLPPQRHPLAVIHIELDPQLVDVNVHPRKAEVRFFQERAIYGVVTQAVANALRDFPMTYTSGATDWSFDQSPISNLESPICESRADYLAGAWRALGQIHNTYILAQTPDGMVIVDQHAAQEQILYERLTTEDERQRTEDLRHPSSVVGQIQLMPREAELLAAHLDEYRALGIDIEPFGENTFRVNALPAFVTLNANEFISALLQEHERYRALDGNALRDKLAAQAACLGAMKAGDALDLAQQQKLLDDLLAIYSPATCPHGRPAFIALRLEELERRFLRR
jgi:DNA mismatch repair protein MutL